MNSPSWQKKYFVLSVLALASLAVDVGFLLAVGSALKWLAEVTSPFLLAGLAAMAILTARVGWSVRSARLIAAR